MNLKIPVGLLEATRLVRGGKIREATAAIQSALRGGGAEPAAERRYAVGDPIEGFCRVVDERPRRHDPGRFVTCSYSNGAGARQYKTYIPATHRANVAAPLLVMLHGCKQGPDDFAAATRMNSLAEEHGFIVVYPAQSGKANVSKCWNWFQGQHQQRDVGEPSLIADITREVVAAYGLDAKRVYIAGLSAGGAMSAVMGATYPELYAAVGVHSGLAYAAARDLPSAFAAMRGEKSKRVRRRPRDAASANGVPTIVFHGDSDTTVHPSNLDDVVEQASPEAAAKAHGNTFAQRERDVERGEAGGRAYTRTTHRDATGKTIMEQWLVHGAAHAWSGGSVEGSYSDPSGPDASREMLRFFLQHQNTR
ncbi:MAG TPA: PHB depolymerase family esterase [Burkholderiales bacterium]|nr:PHB depolymerase family esterase [Burkholderiales bacterium]